MAWQATSWAKQTITGSATKKSVLMVLAERADQWRYCWAGHQLIADEAEIGIRQCQRVTKELARQGLLQIFQLRGRDGRTHNLYRFCADYRPSDEMPPDHPGHNPKWKLIEGLAPGDNMSPGSADPGDNMSPGRATNDAEPGDIAMSPKPTVTSQETVRATSSSPDADGVEDNVAQTPASAYADADPALFDAWETAKRTIMDNRGDGCREWLDDLRVVHNEHGSVCLLASTRFKRDWIRTHFGDAIAETMGKSTVLAVDDPTRGGAS